MKLLKTSSSIFKILETALWCTTDYKDVPLDAYCSVHDVPEELQDKISLEFYKFLDEARPYFTEDELDNSPIERDFWLTVHSHGAGFWDFWDGDYENGYKITEICKKYGPFEDELRESLFKEEV
jgi:hypothetical protein